jgi:uncharacterized protein YkwD
MSSLLVAGTIPIGKTAAQTPSCKNQYNAQTKFLANPDESVLIAGVIGWCRKNQHRLLWDERYAKAARYWSENLVQNKPSSFKSLPTDRIKFELQTHGVTDGNILPFSVEGPVEKMHPEILAFLEQKASQGRYTHFAVGVARTKNQQRMISTLLLGRRPALINSLPMCPTPGSRLDLSLRLLRNYRHPRWLLTTPKGKVINDNLLYEEGAWHSFVPLDSGAGVYQMEIIVHGPAGPEVAALFPLYAGVERPLIPTVKLRPAPTRYRTPEDAEEALVKLVNKTRKKFNLAPLAPDNKLHSVARQYSLQLLADRRATHRTSQAGTLPDRLRRSKISFSRALENVSLSPSPEIAHDRFLDSPGHRLNVLDPNVSKLGVGIAMERGSIEDVLAIVEIFTEPVESGSTSSIANKAAEVINQARRAKGRFALGIDKELAKYALRSARRLAALGSAANPEREGDFVLEELSELVSESADLNVQFFKTTKIRRVLSSEGLYNENINRMGIGVANTSSQNPPGEFWIVVVFSGR